MIKVSIDYKATARQLKDMAREQLPFAFASALTKTAGAAQKQVQNRTKKAFHLHTDFIPKGIRIKPAFKAEILRYGYTSANVLTAPIISRWMPLHEPGGTKESERGRKVAIPGQGLLDQNPKTARGAMRAGMKPGALLRKMDRAQAKPKAKGKGRLPSLPFVMKGPKSGDTLIVQRWGAQRGELRTLYQFRPKAKIDARWAFEETVRRVATRAFGADFDREMRAALASARGR
jgi:hypothetical protein